MCPQAPTGGRNSVNQNDMGCAYASLPPNQYQERSSCATSSMNCLSYCIKINKFLRQKSNFVDMVHAHLKFVYTRHTITDEHKSIARPHNCYVFFRHGTHCCCRMPVLEVNQRSSTSIICFCIVSKTLLNTNCHSLQVNGPIFHTKSCTSSTVPLYDSASNTLE